MLASGGEKKGRKTRMGTHSYRVETIPGKFFPKEMSQPNFLMKEAIMFKNAGVAHFSIAVSDLKASTTFYSDVVGCTLLHTDGKRHSFMDAGGTCVLLCAEGGTINPKERKDLVHHAFIVPPEQFGGMKQHLADHHVEIVEEEDRDGGTVNGPRFYFRDPDGTRLEFINLTSYVNAPR